MASMWRKGMHFLGLGPDEDYDESSDDLLDLRDPPVEEGPAAVRPLPRERGATAVAAVARPARTVVRSLPGSAPSPHVAPAPSPVKPHSLSPTSFNDAQEVGDHFRSGTPVILNLQGVEKDLHRRMVDFASGLCYGLDGDMERVGLHIYLLTPADARVSEEERRSLEARRA